MSYQYAGLAQGHVPGLSVAEVAERLCRFAYIEQRLMRLFAARIVTIPERVIKVLMGRLQYEASLHASNWRARVVELRTPKSKLERVPDAALERFFDKAEEVPETYPFLAVVTKLIKPALRDAYQNYLHDTNGVADYSSVRLVRQNLLDEEEHIHLLSLALDDLAPAATAEALETATMYEHTLASYLAAAGDIDGTQPRIELQSPPGVGDTRQAKKSKHIPRTLMRDDT